MIGAMPAVAVRHERRRAEKRGAGGRRASTLAGREDDPEAGGAPVHAMLYKIFKMVALYSVVCFSLLGIVFLVVGLVQLSPRAEAAQHRNFLIGTGGSMVGLAVSFAVIRCIGTHWYKRKYYDDDSVSEPAPHQVPTAEHKAGHNDHKTGHNDHKIANEKPKLKSQASVGRDLDLKKQASATSDT